MALLAALLNTVTEHGLQAAVHQIGNDITQPAFDRLVAKTPGAIQRLRHRIEHTMGNLARAATVGSYGTLQFGPPDQRMVRFPGMLERWGAGTDWDVIEDINPMNFLEAAAKSLVSVEEALHGYTSNTAKLSHAEHMVGTLEPGKKADLVLFNTNLLSGVNNIRGARPLITMFDGNVVFDTTVHGDANEVGAYETWSAKMQQHGQQIMNQQ